MRNRNKRFLVVYDGITFYVRRVLYNNLRGDLTPNEMHYATRPAKLTPARRKALLVWLGERPTPEGATDP